MLKKHIISIAAALGAMTLGASPGFAQIDSVDPDAALQSAPASAYSGAGTTTDRYDESGFDPAAAEQTDTRASAATDYIPPDTPGNENTAAAAADASAGTAAPGETTYQQDDLIGAATGVFGEGAEGIARMIENILAEQGEPNGYIVGREAGGAFVFGLRYGSGTLYHRIEGERPVYWTGPSVGFDVGANGASTFVLVYNLYDSEELFRRFPAVEGDAYFIGGLTASYMRSGDKVLIPIRLGAGLRLGANLGYMNFSRNRRWLPF